MAVGCGGSSSSRRTESVETLIIGSGFGGSIAAYRLAQAGHRSVVLERGRRWTTVSDPTSPDYDVFSDMELGGVDQRSSWLSRNQPLPGLVSGPLRPYTGVLEKIFGDGINIVCPAAVGGGSVVYSGMMVKPPQDLFDEVFPDGVSFAEMDATYYPRVEAIMQPGRLPDDLLAMEPWTATRTFIQQAQDAGYEAERLLCAFDFERARAEATGELPPQLIRGSYIFGLNSGAKRTLDKAYLGMAEDTGLCDVRPLHWVQRIAQHAEGYYVEVDIIDTTGAVLEQVAFTARRLFVCAGTANTNGLLSRAKSEMTLPELPDELGSGFGNNGQHIMARDMVGVDTGQFQAGPACAMIFDYENRIAMENGPAPLGAIANQTLIGTGQGVPSGRGRIFWDETAGRVGVEWSAEHDAQAAEAARNILERINATVGGRITTIPGLNESVTFHPLGGCVMGETTDLFGRVRNHTGLYVLDGSLIPGSTPCSNPFWTISANAERCIERIVLEDYA